MKNASPLGDGAETRTTFDMKMWLGTPHKIDCCADICPFTRHRRRSHILPEDGAEALTKFDMKMRLGTPLKIHCKNKTHR